MNEYPNYTFTQSAAQYNEWMADKYPKLNDQIKQRIKEGRWEIVGGMWVEPDLNLPGGESLVRQLLVGQRFFQKEYGVTARIGWNPDSFGYNWQLPQIYKRSGVDYFVTQKMHWNDTNQLPFRLFWWESPDGSKVLTYFPTDYVHDNVNPARISGDFAESAERNPGTSEMMDLYGIGDHGGGPTRAMLDQAETTLASAPGKPSSSPSPPCATAPRSTTSPPSRPRPRPTPPPGTTTPSARARHRPPPGPGQIGIPTWKDELYFEYHRGIFTTQANHKHNMRASETRHPRRREARLSRLAQRRPLPRTTSSPKTGRRSPSTSSTISPPAPASPSSTATRRRTTTEGLHVPITIIAEDSLSIHRRPSRHTREGTRVAYPILLFNPLAWPRSESGRAHRPASRARRRHPPTLDDRD